MSIATFVRSASAVALITFGDVGGFQVAHKALGGPHFEYSTTVGCGDVFFHSVNSDETEFLQIEARFEQLTGSGMRETFDLMRPLPGLDVVVAVYPERQVNRPNCTDVVIAEVGKPPVVPVVWRAIRGQLLVERGPKGVKAAEPWLFHVRLRLEQAAFQAPDGQIIEMKRPFTWEGYVGWQAG